MADGDELWRAVSASTRWLNESNGASEHELTCRILKLSEETGEVAAAWMGVLGQNPRKGVTHHKNDVAAELADVAISALVAIESLGCDPQAVIAECVAKINSRSRDAQTS